MESEKTNILKLCGDDFFTKLEEEIGTKIPLYVKNILKLNGFDSALLLSRMEDSTIYDIEEYMQNDFEIENFEEAADYLGTFIKSQKKFKFSNGHNMLLRIISDTCRGYYVNSYPIIVTMPVIGSENNWRYYQEQIINPTLTSGKDVLIEFKDSEEARLTTHSTYDYKCSAMPLESKEVRQGTDTSTMNLSKRHYSNDERSLSEDDSSEYKRNASLKTSVNNTDTYTMNLTKRYSSDKSSLSEDDSSEDKRNSSFESSVNKVILNINSRSEEIFSDEENFSDGKKMESIIESTSKQVKSANNSGSDIDSLEEETEESPLKTVTILGLVRKWLVEKSSSNNRTCSDEESPAAKEKMTPNDINSTDEYTYNEHAVVEPAAKRVKWNNITTGNKASLLPNFDEDATDQVTSFNKRILRDSKIKDDEGSVSNYKQKNCCEIIVNTGEKKHSRILRNKRFPQSSDVKSNY